MVKGAAVGFTSYEASVGKLLNALQLDRELKKYDTIVLKPFLHNPGEQHTPVEFVEQVLRYCMNNKNPVADVFIAEGADGHDTMDLYDDLGYRKLAEKFGIGLIDLNVADTTTIQDGNFSHFESIEYPTLLKDSFVISLAKLGEDEELGMTGSVASMIGAFPAKHYKGFFSRSKSKIRKWPIEHSIRDISLCKLPEFAIIDASEKGMIFAGQPLEIDKQAARHLGKDWKNIKHLRLVDESLSTRTPVSKTNEPIDVTPLK